MWLAVLHAFGKSYLKMKAIKAGLGKVMRETKAFKIMKSGNTGDIKTPKLSQEVSEYILGAKMELWKNQGVGYIFTNEGDESD